LIDLRGPVRVLIHAAGGGVGHLAVQIAKARGTHVIGTASASKHDLLRELGIDEALTIATPVRGRQSGCGERRLPSRVVVV
jgi:NADPH:quinone reductase-like Zn-dependent oxidoreductase